MAKDTHNTDEKTETATKVEKVSVDQGKRRFAIGLAAGVPAIMTLAPRPVWADVNCSASAIASANSSLNPGHETCALGCTPGYWSTNGQENRDGITGWTLAWEATGLTPDTSFVRVFRLYEILSQDQLKVWDDVTLAEALMPSEKVGENVHVRNCAFQATAGVLNASHPSLAPGYNFNGVRLTRSEIIYRFQEAYLAFINHPGQGQGNSTLLLKNLQSELGDANKDGACIIDAGNFDPNKP